MSNLRRKTEKAIAEAISKNMTVTYGSPTTLLLDLDLDKDPQAEKTYKENLLMLQEFVAVIELQRWRSKSGNLHVVVQLPYPLPITERLLLQAVLGSDLKRELLGYLKLYDGSDQHNVLFRPGGNHAPF